MKKLLLLVILLSYSFANAQNYTEAYKKEVLKFQKGMDGKFKSQQESPLTKEDLKDFSSLEYFPIDSSYRVVAKLEKIENSTPFKMQTTTDRLPVYITYAKASFTLKGKEYELHLYQNENILISDSKNKDLFLPFTDLTNGDSSYGGGRYIDLEIPKEDTIVIDFNKSYNPYCAYNSKYSCPVPPRANNLNTAINAGIKNYKKH